MTLKFECRYCPATFSQLKDLFDHWENSHRNICKLYILEHRKSKQVASAIAPSAQEACFRFDWYIGDCYIRQEELKEGIMLELTNATVEWLDREEYYQFGKSDQRQADARAILGRIIERGTDGYKDSELMSVIKLRMTYKEYQQLKELAK